MTPDKQRVAIAEYCGLLKPPVCKPSIEQLEAILDSKSPMSVEILPNGEIRAIPDYLNDLNAIQQAWQCLGWEEKNEYIEHLKEIVEEADCEVYFATAEQRCEAFLKTINLWSEE